MRAARSIHLLIAAAILFSQIVSGVHMAGHVHLPESSLSAARAPVFTTVMASGSASGTTSTDNSALVAMHAIHPEQLTAPEHEALHRLELAASSEPAHGKAYLDKSCAIYHIYAGSHCVAANTGAVSRPLFVASSQATIEFPALLVRRIEHYVIRGPPVLS